MPVSLFPLFFRLCAPYPGWVWTLDAGNWHFYFVPLPFLAVIRTGPCTWHITSLAAARSILALTLLPFSLPLFSSGG